VIELAALPGQKQLISSRSKRVCFVGGYGSGKTRAAVYKALVLGFENAPCVGIFVEPTFTMVRDVAIRSFQEVFGEYGIKYTFNKTEHLMRVEDTFDILFRSGDQPERLVGINAGWAIIDEPAIQTEDVAKAVLSRLRDPRSKLPQLVLTGTPEGFNWFHDWCFSDGVELIRAKTTDNPYLSPEYIESMRERYTAEEVEAYINGEFVRFESGWFKTTPRVLPTVEQIQYPNGVLKCYVSKDRCTDQLVMGIDTAGGLDRDKSAICLLDKRGPTLVASYVSGTDTIDMLTSVAHDLYLKYRKEDKVGYPGFDKVNSSSPVVLVEINGIGRATYQSLTATRGVPCLEVSTSEATRYRGMQATRREVEKGTLEGPEELVEETKSVTVEAGKFKGPKDLSMAIGFCLNHIEATPYVSPIQKKQEQTVAFKLGKSNYW
jgi:hypothetical protein